MNEQSRGAGAPGDEREAALERAWRAVSTEEPPAEVDAAILAAARRSVASAGAGLASRTASPREVRTRRGVRPWQSFAAAAGVAGLAFVLVQSLPRESTSITPMSAPTPPYVERESPAMKTPTEAARTEDVAPAAAPDPPEASPSSAPAASTSPGKPAVAPEIQRTVPPAPPPPVANEAAVSTTRESRPTSGYARAPAPGAVVAAPDASTSQSRAGAPLHDAMSELDVRVDRIVSLYESGDRAGAAEELRALRAEDGNADERLPESLREWARGVE